MTARRIPLPDDHTDPALCGIQTDAFTRLLETGRPVPVAELAQAEDATEAVRLLRARGRMTITESGDVAGSLGLTVRPTPHRLALAEGVRYTWCALDAVAIMAALGRSGTVMSTVPDDAGTVTIRFETGRVAEAPPGLVLLVPSEAAGPVVETWCPLANLFPDAATAHAWARARGLTGYSLLELAEAIAEGAPLWTNVLGRNGDRPEGDGS